MMGLRVAKLGGKPRGHIWMSPCIYKAVSGGRSHLHKLHLELLGEIPGGSLMVGGRLEELYPNRFGIVLVSMFVALTGGPHLELRMETAEFLLDEENL